MKQSKSYYVRNTITGEFLNDTETCSFGENPIKLTYSKAHRLCTRITKASQFQKPVEIYLIKNK